MIKEVLEFEPKFSEYDLERVVSCANSKECLYVVAGIISRIRSKQMVQFHIQKTRENVISLI